jgi:hypothetical protein
MPKNCADCTSLCFPLSVGVLGLHGFVGTVYDHIRMFFPVADAAGKGPAKGNTAVDRPHWQELSEAGKAERPPVQAPVPTTSREDVEVLACLFLVAEHNHEMQSPCDP